MVGFFIQYPPLYFILAGHRVRRERPSSVKHDSMVYVCKSKTGCKFAAKLADDGWQLVSEARATHNHSVASGHVFTVDLYDKITGSEDLLDTHYVDKKGYLMRKKNKTRADSRLVCCMNDCSAVCLNDGTFTYLDGKGHQHQSKKIVWVNEREINGIIVTEQFVHSTEDANRIAVLGGQIAVLTDPMMFPPPASPPSSAQAKSTSSRKRKTPDGASGRQQTAPKRKAAQLQGRNRSTGQNSPAHPTIDLTGNRHQVNLSALPRRVLLGDEEEDDPIVVSIQLATASAAAASSTNSVITASSTTTAPAAATTAVTSSVVSLASTSTSTSSSSGSAATASLTTSVVSTASSTSSTHPTSAPAAAASSTTSVITAPTTTTAPAAATTAVTSLVVSLASTSTSTSSSSGTAAAASLTTSVVSTASSPSSTHPPSAPAAAASSTTSVITAPTITTAPAAATTLTTPVVSSASATASTPLISAAAVAPPPSLTTYSHISVKLTKEQMGFTFPTKVLKKKVGELETMIESKGVRYPDEETKKAFEEFNFRHVPKAKKEKVGIWNFIPYSNHPSEIIKNCAYFDFMRGKLQLYPECKMRKLCQELCGGLADFDSSCGHQNLCSPCRGSGGCQVCKMPKSANEESLSTQDKNIKAIAEWADDTTILIHTRFVVENQQQADLILAGDFLKLGNAALVLLVLNGVKLPHGLDLDDVEAICLFLRWIITSRTDVPCFVCKNNIRCFIKHCGHSDQCHECASKYKCLTCPASERVHVYVRGYLGLEHAVLPGLPSAN